MSHKVLSFRELVRKFKKLGFEGPYGGGRHLFMIKGPQKIRIPNPHGSKDIHISLVHEILRQAGINSKKWEKT
ncbi:MAG: hypothetical protein A3H42_05510 [Deltaproteobacteria bacterium RIFCSPLOWO2_02_FULL_46_8]|nr:MAG: hypothetical protein A3H42_05510 [Deltaproteobacteria bacterium RIFCSPLOWO2_02_FULL_46_8]